jgi:hypothetical protein
MKNRNLGKCKDKLKTIAANVDAHIDRHANTEDLAVLIMATWFISNYDSTTNDILWN